MGMQEPTVAPPHRAPPGQGSAHPLVRKMRKSLGRFKRSLISYNSDHWYALRLSGKCGGCDGARRTGTMVNVVSHDRAVLIEWLERHRVHYAWIYDEKEIRCARANGHRYYYATNRGEISGYLKVALRRAYIRDYEGEIPLGNDEAFVYDTFTLPECRGSGLGTRLLTGALADLKASGIDYVYCQIPDWNKASIKLYQGSGFTRARRVRYLRLLSWRFFLAHPSSIMDIARNGAGCAPLERGVKVLTAANR